MDEMIKNKFILIQSLSQYISDKSFKKILFSNSRDYSFTRIYTKPFVDISLQYKQLLDKFYVAHLSITNLYT